MSSVIGLAVKGIGWQNMTWEYWSNGALAYWKEHDIQIVHLANTPLLHDGFCILWLDFLDFFVCILS